MFSEVWDGVEHEANTKIREGQPITQLHKIIDERIVGLQMANKMFLESVGNTDVLSAIFLLNIKLL